MRNIIQICNDNDLTVDENTNFKDFIKEIYYNFTIGDFRKLMNDIMEEEVIYGEQIFD